MENLNETLYTDLNNAQASLINARLEIDELKRAVEEHKCVIALKDTALLQQLKTNNNLRNDLHGIEAKQVLEIAEEIISFADSDIARGNTINFTKMHEYNQRQYNILLTKGSSKNWNFFNKYSK